MQRADNSARARNRAGQEGGALAFVVIITMAVTLIGVYSLNITLSDRKQSVHGYHGKTGLTCADTAIERARPFAMANQAEWNTVWAGSAVWWHPLTGTCPNFPTYTYSVTIRDNVDETSGANNPLLDVDKTAILDAVVSRGTTPVAAVSAMIGSETKTQLEDYGKQGGHGAMQLGNQ